MCQTVKSAEHKAGKKHAIEVGTRRIARPRRVWLVVLWSVCGAHIPPPSSLSFGWCVVLISGEHEGNHVLHVRRQREGKGRMDRRHRPRHRAGTHIVHHLPSFLSFPLSRPSPIQIPLQHSLLDFCVYLHPTVPPPLLFDQASSTLIKEDPAGAAGTGGAAADDSEEETDVPFNPNA